MELIQEQPHNGNVTHPSSKMENSYTFLCREGGWREGRREGGTEGGRETRRTGAGKDRGTEEGEEGGEEGGEEERKCDRENDNICTGTLRHNQQATFINRTSVIYPNIHKHSMIKSYACKVHSAFHT